MSVDKKLPEIRFKGFSEEWEEKALGEVFTYERPDNYIVQSATYSNDCSTPVLTANKGFILGYTNEKSTYNNPSIIFDDFTLDCKFIDFPYMVKSSAIKILTVKDNTRDDLLFSFHLLNITQIEVMGHARHYISVVQNTKVTVPKKSEQTAIGNTFQKLDSLIKQHQQKHDKLSNFKKAMLEKMFPKQGETTPEIRFKGFSGAWEKDTVSALLSERNEQAPKSENYPLMAFVADKGVASKGDRYNRDFLVNDELNKKYKKTEMGDFIYSSNNLETGSIGLNNYGPASISPVYSIFQPTSLADSEFVGCLLIRKNFINQMVKWRQGVVYGQWRIHESDFLNIEVKFTSLGEQEKIGNYFQNLDSLINQHQQQITKLGNIKQACLRKMFV